MSMIYYAHMRKILNNYYNITQINNKIYINLQNKMPSSLMNPELIHHVLQKETLLSRLYRKNKQYLANGILKTNST